MPSGYLVTLGDGSLDTGDTIGGSYTSFTTDEILGDGNWIWTGRDGRRNYTNQEEPGTFYLATNGNVYFEPAYGSVGRLTSATADSPPAYGQADGIIDGTDDAELIDQDYTDADGDQIDSAADNADSVIAAGGDDTVQSGDGQDTVFGGFGDDVVEGGAGADLIYGDNETDPATTSTSEVMSWDSQAADGADVSGGFTQTTGEMDVSVSFSNLGDNAPDFLIESSDASYVATGETFDTTSTLRLYGDGDGLTSSTTFSFAATSGSDMQDAVENLAFRINDIDWGDANHTDIVTVNAYDADGNAVSVTITVGSGDTVAGNTITAETVAEDMADLGGSALIEIAGPVSSVEILYSNGQDGTQAIWVSDLHFDTMVLTGGDDDLSGGAGADTLYGQDGDDTLAGDAGTDSLEGGDGADSLAGGADSDTLIGGAGNDTLQGGAGGDSMSGGAGMDYLDYSDSDAAVAIDLTTNTASGGHAANDTLAGGLDGIIGSDWDDTLTGYDGEGSDWTNVFYGGGGADLMDGADGDDFLYGEEGADTLIGGAGADLIDGGEGDDLIYAGSGDTITGGAGNDTIVLDDTNLGGGVITIDGSETDEPGGDTLDLSGLADWDDVTFTNTDPDELAGQVTLDDTTVINFSNIEDLVICFTGGTKILTAQGARLVETLRPGDMVLTRDHGMQPIRWIGSRAVQGVGKFAPIRFAPGAIGNDTTLLVSPQHRMLHQSSAANLYFNDSEVLIPAKHMVNGTSIQQLDQVKVEYFHILFDTHEIVFAEGVPSESFHPGQMGLSAITDPAREELFALFPELRSNPNGFGDTARLCLRAHEARLLAA